MQSSDFAEALQEYKPNLHIFKILPRFIFKSRKIFNEQLQSVYSFPNLVLNILIQLAVGLIRRTH